MSTFAVDVGCYNTQYSPDFLLGLRRSGAGGHVSETVAVAIHELGLRRRQRGRRAGCRHAKPRPPAVVSTTESLDSCVAGCDQLTEQSSAIPVITGRRRFTTSQRNRSRRSRQTFLRHINLQHDVNRDKPAVL